MMADTDAEAQVVFTDKPNQHPTCCSATGDSFNDAFYTQTEVTEFPRLARDATAPTANATTIGLRVC